ncbi:MAG: gliding motility-associated C-terminal domain-containing protein [Bacteroidota bacterium]
MIYKYLLFFGVIALSLAPWSISGQNLIPNGGFEELDICPTDAGQAHTLPGWRGILTPDLYHLCSENMNIQPPRVRICDMVSPHAGEAFIGMYVYGPGTGEFMETTLIEPLEAGQLYYLQFYVRPDSDCQISQVTFTDAIALAFSSGNQTFQTGLENRGTILRDTENWTLIEGCYIASGGERIARIGNFLSDENTLVENIPPNPGVSFNYLFLDEFHLQAFDQLDDTLYLCPNETILLNVTMPEARYLWSTGDTSAILEVAEAGLYTVEISAGGCMYEEVIEVLPLPDLGSQLPDTTMCTGQSIELLAPLPGQYQWSNGQTAERIQINQPGTYSVTIENNCGIFSFSRAVIEEPCDCNIFVPTAFSPNSDGINDRLEVFSSCEYPSRIIRFQVFDRWGSLVYTEDDNMAPAWSGKINEKPAATGVYIWSLEYELMANEEAIRREVSGHAVLLR